MPLTITYDVTRLCTRLLTVTPNGIDRVENAFADHFLPAALPQDRSGTIWTPLGPRMMPVRAAREVLDDLNGHWGELRQGEDDQIYAAAIARLRGERRAPSVEPAARIQTVRTGRIGRVARWFRHNGLPLGRTPERDLPQGARYLNVSQFPLWSPSHFHWLERRPDVKAVFFIHDLLPLQFPEYFPDAEENRHRRRMTNLARFGTGAIVTTNAVRDALDSHLRTLGRSDFPILVAPTPMSPIFLAPPRPDPAVAGVDYFVICSTIEPRKNHRLLLEIWRELVWSLGASAPRLLVIGRRGWKFGPVVDLLDRSPALRSHVIELSGLSTPALRRLLDGARALLMPTFGEGYGLPVHEALAAGVPVIVSDVPAMADLTGPLVTRLSPIDGLGWLNAIRAAMTAERPAVDDKGLPTEIIVQTWTSYFSKVDDFIADL